MKRFALLILPFLMASCSGFYIDKMEAGDSVTKVADNLWSMRYMGDYKFEEFLKQGGASSDGQVSEYLNGMLRATKSVDLQEEGYGCSTICTQDSLGNVYFGRNFDWKDCRIMTVMTVPYDGYMSISTANLDVLGFGDNWKPDGRRGDRTQALAAVYVPLDGMNEMGLCVADLIVSGQEETHQDTGKPDLTTTTAIRLLLDRAGDVDKAIALLEKYDMHSSAGEQHHLAICDTTGRSVVVEYVDNEMQVLETPIVTNFYLTPEKYGIGGDPGQERFGKLLARYEKNNGILDAIGVKDALAEVEQKGTTDPSDKTQWSIVFDPRSYHAVYKVGEKLMLSIFLR